MSVGGKKSSSKQESKSSINPFSQVAARAIFASLLGQDAYDQLGIGSLHGGDPGNAAPTSPHSSLSGVLPDKTAELDRINSVRNALRGKFQSFDSGSYYNPQGGPGGGGMGGVQ